MNLVNLKKVSDREVRMWLEDSIKDLSPYQREYIRDKEIIRFAPFYFMEKREKVNNVLLRFTILFILPVLLVLIVGLPFNFLITGCWGYDHNKMKWFSKWVSSCGL